uniref:HTH_38 domain-containing protein n=1 Tax=Heterorhabditis bacteriophora TaxID=37862 RepID=A0A1I7XE98_HETBA
MSRASTLSLHERGQIKALSTTGYTVKRIADVVKRSRKVIMNFLRHQNEYSTKKSSGRPSKLNDREKREILRTPSNKTISIVGIRSTCGIDAFRIYGVENAGQVSQYCPITNEEVSTTDTRT